MRLPGRRSTGGVVKAGHGGWTILWTGRSPTLGYTNPDTGDGASRAGWNLVRSYRWIKQMAERRRAERAAGVRAAQVRPTSEETS